MAYNLTSQAWSSSYDLLVVQGAGATACTKQWWVSSWVTATTPGGRCASTLFSSSYDCPATCSWDAQQRMGVLAQCTGMRAPTLPAGAPPSAANSSCLLHLPCNRLSTDPAAADGPCWCCDMELTGAALPRAPPCLPACLPASVLPAPLTLTPNQPIQHHGAALPSSSVPAGVLWVLLLGQAAFLVWALFHTRTQVG